jgi:hypothetical protein
MCVDFLDESEGAWNNTQLRWPALVILVSPARIYPNRLYYDHS